MNECPYVLPPHGSCAIVHPTLVTADRDKSDKGCNVEALVFGLSFELLQVLFQSVDLVEQMLHALKQSRELLRCSRVLTDRHHHLLLLLTAGRPAAAGYAALTMRQEVDGV